MRSALVAFLAVAALCGCPTTPDVPRPTIADDSTFLGLAVGEVSELLDPLARADLYARLADGYREVGDFRSMLSLATTALNLARSVGETEESVRARLRLSPLFAAAGSDQSALTALRSGLEFAAASSDAELKATLLPTIVRYALQSDEPARPVVRDAIDEVYVIEEPRRRAEALIRIAELSRAGGPALSVTGLIQQAIPAVRSVNDSLRRAALFAQLAELASATSEARLADRLVQNVITEMRASESPDTDNERESFLAVIGRLASLGRPDAALELSRAVVQPDLAAEGHILVASATESQSSRLELLSVAGALAEEVTDTQRYVLVQTHLGGAYAQAQSRASAFRHAETAAAILAVNPSLYSRIEPPARLVSLLVDIDRLQSVRDLLLLAPDDYVQGAVAVRAAEQLIRDGRLGLADDFLTLALVASDEASYLADGLREEIVAGFARTGSIRLAIRTIERMKDELSRARAVTDLAVVAEPAGLLTPIYRADLASVLASF